MRIRFFYTFSVVFLLCYKCIFAQTPIPLVDGLNAKECNEINKMLDLKPREVLWGISFGEKGEIKISLTNKDWLYKILKSPQDGISVDLIEKGNYDCKNEKTLASNLIKGDATNPIYLDEIKKKAKAERGIEIEVGRLPKGFEGKEYEGNLMLVRDKKVCYYQSFIQIPRSRWGLLPMGFFTNTYIQESQNNEDKLSFIYEKKLQFIVPFPKNKATYNQQDLKMVFDSLANTGYEIKKIDIRAYASVEGTSENNAILQEKRANAMIEALKPFQDSEIQKVVSTAENWIEFMKDVEQTSFKNLSNFSQNQIKKELEKNEVAKQLEPILQKHRKAVLTVFLDKKSDYEKTSKENLLSQFSQTIQKKEMNKAVAIQKEIFDRIAEKRLPTDFLNQLEVPEEKRMSVLVNNKIVYDYLLENNKNKEILERLVKLEALDPTNGRIKYNICAVKMKIWEVDSTTTKANDFFEEIKKLRDLKIDNSLVRRMIMNFYILKAEQHIERNEYKKKDESVDFILKRYKDLNLTDDDLLSISKFMTNYLRKKEATEIISNRLDKIDVNEDLLFYYINLMLFDENKMNDLDFRKSIENAVIINRKRFCKYFNSISKGGASFQLLDDYKLKDFYCEACK